MITIANVAERAGVSTTTVSHTLSGKRPVAEETRRKVEQVIKELGFRPNVLARSLRMQRSQTVAFILPDITNPFYPLLARGLQDTLMKQQYHTLLCNTDGQSEQELAFLEDAVYRQVDGIVLVSFQLTTRDIEHVIAANIPVVSLGSLIDHPLVDIVRPEDMQGARDATAYLIDHGHRRIGIITGPAGLQPSDSRLAGYREALTMAAIPFQPSLVERGNFVRQGGYEAMGRLLTLEERPSAVFCANDLLAIGAMDMLQEAHLRVPFDMALVGFDDIEVASLLTPALTTILNPAYELGTRAGQFLLERMMGQYQGESRHVIALHRIIERDSVLQLSRIE